MNASESAGIRQNRLAGRAKHWQGTNCGESCASLQVNLDRSTAAQ